MNVVKFPYNLSRRAHSQRPRVSKNGTPAERAAKAAAAAAEITPATVTEISGRSDDNQRPEETGTTLLKFTQTLRSHFVQEFARGRDLDQIFDALEDSYRRLDKALRNYKARGADRSGSAT